MSSTDFAQFKILFIQTARRQLVLLEEAIQGLEKDSKNKEATNIGYIAAHSLKGECLALGYTQNAAIAQLIEKIFHALNQDSLTLSTAILVAISTSLKKLSGSIDSIEKTDRESTSETDVEELERASGVTRIE